MKWFYTEGKLTVSSDEEERKFLLSDLLTETSHREKITSITKMFFFFILVALCVLQFSFVEFPKEEGVYFYIGYLSTPLLISIIPSVLLFVILKNRRKEVKALVKIFKEKD